MNPYSYPNVEPCFNLRLKQTSKRWLHYTVDFPIAQPTQYQEHNIARGEYFRPCSEQSRPLAILVHGWGNNSAIPCKLLARNLVKRGIACFIIYLVFHTSRMPEVIRNRLPHLTPDEWFEGYKTSVIDVCHIVDWARTVEEINKEQIAVIGISLGGFISAISMGIDKRIHAGVFLLSGGNYESPAWLMKWHNDREETEYTEAQSRYSHYLAEVAEKGFANVIPAKKSFLTDPVTFARYLNERPMIMINALWDKKVPRQTTLDLWEACGRPGIKWFPAGHSTI